MPQSRLALVMTVFAFFAEFRPAFSKSSTFLGSSAPRIEPRLVLELTTVSSLDLSPSSTFFQPIQSLFTRPLRCIRFCGDFALAHTLKNCEIDAAVLLRGWQAGYDFAVIEAACR